MKRYGVLLLTAAALLVLAIAFVSPTAAGPGHDRWSGVWKVGNGKDTFGKMKLKLRNNDIDVEGTYDYSGGGTINGELDEKFGKVWEGGYSDRKGSGSFKVKSKEHGERFEGWFQPYGTNRKLEWEGKLQ